jgi:hypothetical protein
MNFMSIVSLTLMVTFGVGLQETLWNTCRSSWMTVKDLSFVESNMIPRIEMFIDQMARFDGELSQNALQNAAAEEEKEAAKARGEVGISKTAKKPKTRPISPNITRPSAPILPEPEKISTDVKAKDVPDYLDRLTMEKMTAKRLKDKEMIKKQTLSQYTTGQQFKFHETKSGKPLDEVRREIEEERSKELRFNSAYYHPPPDFSKKLEFRDNVSTILREDALYRKQQEKDAQILRKYEEELRDPTEYYLWQQDMRERDETEKLKHVSMRRDQAKQSSEEAKYAMQKQQEDNAQIASMVREQGDVIKRQMVLEREIEMLTKQDIVQTVISVRETKPQEASERMLKERSEKGKSVRIELEQKRIAKAQEDREQEEIKADRIRQLRALNTVHKAHVVVFDPTETAGIGLLDEMSYMEMKERQKIEKRKQDEQIQLKTIEIHKEKTKKQLDLERRSESIYRARQLKAEANRSLREKTLAQRSKEKSDLEEARVIADQQWECELAVRQASKKAERDALAAEEERIKRQQQYLGVAHGQVAVLREREMQMARDRQVLKLQEEFDMLMSHNEETTAKEKANKIVLSKRETKACNAIEQDRAEQFSFEKQSSIQKIKEDVVYKKTMFNEGQIQHERTKTTLYETNPYGAKISQDIRTTAATRRNKMLESIQ